MKRIFPCIAALVCTVALAACQAAPDLPPSSASEVPVSSAPASSEAVSSETPSQPVSSEAPPEQALTVRAADDTPLPKREIAAQPLRYTEAFGGRKEKKNALPSIDCFDYPNLYYSVMSAAVKGEDPNAGLHVGRYSLDTNVKQELATLGFTDMTNASQLLMDGRYLFYLPFHSDDEGQMELEITMFDLQNNTHKSIFTCLSHNIFAYSTQLNADEAVFFLYEQVTPRTETDGGQTQQKVITYNIPEDKITTIYQGENMDWTSDTDSTRDIWAIDADQGKIYLLMHQLINGKMTTWLRTLDENGNQLDEQELTALAKYGTFDQTVDSLTVQGDYLFVRYNQWQNLHSNPPFAILQKTGKGYENLRLGDTYPRNPLTPEPIQGRYLCFDTFSQKNDAFWSHNTPYNLFFFDLQTGEAALLDLGIPETLASICCDKSGNVVVTTALDDAGKQTPKMYFFDQADVMKKVTAAFGAAE